MRSGFGASGGLVDHALRRMGSWFTLPFAGPQETNSHASDLVIVLGERQSHIEATRLIFAT